MTSNHPRWALAIALAGAIISGAVVGRGTAAPAGKTLDGFTFGEVRFDESTGTAKPTPIIPKGWKFLGVGNGSHANASQLWFQDGDGAIYVLHGFRDSGHFVLDQRIQKLAVGN